MKSTRLNPCLILGLLGLTFTQTSLNAAITVSGDASPNSGDAYWASGGNGSTDVFLGNMDNGSASLTINGGSDLDSYKAHIGLNTGGSADATVTGFSSTWDNSAEVVVGFHGSGSLEILNGAKVTNSDAGYVGYQSGSVGTVTVDGSGSSWNNMGGVVGIGVTGSGILHVLDGASVSGGNGFVGGSEFGSGSVTVDGSGSTWTNSGSLTVGGSGVGVLTVSDGGSVTNAEGNIGQHSISPETSSVTVRDSGSTWDMTGILYVGRSGDGALNVEAGGEVSSLAGIIGNGATSDSSAIIDGAGSKWSNSGNLYVGYDGSGSMDITNGGSVESASGYVGYNSGFSGEVVVSGLGSSWANAIGLQVGVGGSGTLDISDGGSVSVASTSGATIGQGGSVTVSGVGSEFTVSSGTLHVAGQLEVTNGGSLDSGFATSLATGSGSSGSLVVDAATMDSGSALYVGQSGQATVEVANGGSITAGTTYLGYNYGSVGEMTLGAGSSLNASEVNVGFGFGGTGSLTVKDGAVVLSKGSINVDGGGGSNVVNLYVSGNGVLRAGTDGTGNFVNNDTVNVFAYASLAAGSYTPIEVGSTTGSFSGSGDYNAFGGTWDAVNNQFVVAAITDGSGGVIAQDLSGQRLSFDAGNVVATFKDDAGVADFDASALTPGSLGGDSVLAAYSFATDLSGSDVLLSFNLGMGFDAEDFSLWHLEETPGAEWTLLFPDTVSYEDGWVSFSVAGFSSYAVTAVPEPSAFALLGGILAFGWVFLQRRR